METEQANRKIRKSWLIGGGIAALIVIIIVIAVPVALSVSKSRAPVKQELVEKVDSPQIPRNIAKKAICKPGSASEHHATYALESNDCSMYNSADDKYVKSVKEPQKSQQPIEGTPEENRTKVGRNPNARQNDQTGGCLDSSSNVGNRAPQPTQKQSQDDEDDLSLNFELIPPMPEIRPSAPDFAEIGNPRFGNWRFDHITQKMRETGDYNLNYFGNPEFREGPCDSPFPGYATPRYYSDGTPKPILPFLDPECRTDFPRLYPDLPRKGSGFAPEFDVASDSSRVDETPLVVLPTEGENSTDALLPGFLKTRCSDYGFESSVLTDKINERNAEKIGGLTCLSPATTNVLHAIDKPDAAYCLLKSITGMKRKKLRHGIFNTVARTKTWMLKFLEARVEYETKFSIDFEFGQTSMIVDIIKGRSSIVDGLDVVESEGTPFKLPGKSGLRQIASDVLQYLKGDVVNLGPYEFELLAKSYNLQVGLVDLKHRYFLPLNTTRDGFLLQISNSDGCASYQQLVVLSPTSCTGGIFEIARSAVFSDLIALFKECNF